MKRIGIRKTFIALCILALGSILWMNLNSVSAQGIPVSDEPGPNISLNSSNNTPSPGQTITLTVVSYATDLSRATVTWYVNGKKVSSGTGDTTYNVTVGGEGSSLTITVSILTSLGQVAEKSLTFNPSSIDLVWHALSYIPPFYEGKALFPSQGTVVVSAIPAFVNNPQDAVYTWSENGDVIAGASGYGKDSVTISQALIAEPFTVTVQVSSMDNSASGQKTINFNGQEPQIIFYEDNPLYGVQYQNALTDSFSLTDQEINLKAVPYFFGITSPGDDSTLNYNWSINGSNIPSAQNNTDEVTLRKPSSAGGQADISLQINNPSKILQYTNSTIEVNF